MTRFFTVLILAVCCMGGSAIAQAPAQQGEAGITSMCITEMSKQDQLGIDVKKYCSCLGGRLARHENKLEHTDGTRTRQQVMNDLTPCFDDHMKAPVMNLCKGFNDKMAAEKQKVKMDCGCYYSKMVDNFSNAWAQNLANTPATADEQAMLAQQAVASCARDLP